MAKAAAATAPASPVPTKRARLIRGSPGGNSTDTEANTPPPPAKRRSPKKKGGKSTAIEGEDGEGEAAAAPSNAGTLPRGIPVVTPETADSKAIPQEASAISAEEQLILDGGGGRRTVSHRRTVNLRNNHNNSNNSSTNNVILDADEDEEEDDEAEDEGMHAAGGVMGGRGPGIAIAKAQKTGGIALSRTKCLASVDRVYSLVQKSSGAVGGNGYFGAIYGELTMVCFQKVVDLLKEHCQFDSSCSFIDIGSGLGRPNFHVAQDPGVEVSFGLELETIRWQLSICNLRSVLLAGEGGGGEVDRREAGGGGGGGGGDGAAVLKQKNTFFKLGDITNATTFNPFTHIYTFDIGFPPATLKIMADAFNRSKAPYLINFHSPRYTIERDGFDVEFVCQASSLRLSGSGESHTMYIYRRKGWMKNGVAQPIRQITELDPLFEEGVELCRGPSTYQEMLTHVQDLHNAYTDSDRSMRSKSKREEADR